MDVGKTSSTILFIFQHCRNDINIFCFSLPKLCPLCDNYIAESRLPLYRLQTPFSEQRLSPQCLLIKPAKGDFLHDYSVEKDLHVGVTNSKCTLYHFDYNGLNLSTPSFEEWTDCISINIMDLLPLEERSRISSLWDSRLYETMRSEEWIDRKYEKNLKNCYTFVLSFLSDLGIEQFLPSIRDKTTFCRQFVMKNLIEAYEYLRIYKNLRLYKVYWTNSIEYTSTNGKNANHKNDVIA